MVTTIFPPSDAVRKIAQDPDWCTIIVADRKTQSKSDYLAELNVNTTDAIIFLSPDDQEYAFPLLSQFLPWNNFARKNIGYMYAIKQGASLIWDFDDDNINVVPIRLVNVVDYRIPCGNASYPLFSLIHTSWSTKHTPGHAGFPLNIFGINKQYQSCAIQLRDETSQWSNHWLIYNLM